MSNLKDLRSEMDLINEQLTQLLIKRLDLSKQIAQYKFENNIAVYDPQRENDILNSIDAGEYTDEIREIYKSIMNSSKVCQSKYLA